MLDESDAIQAIKRLGGSVEHDNSLPNSPVIAVKLYHRPDFRDQHVELLKAFKNLKHLDVMSHNLGEAGLLEIGSLAGLISLDLRAGHAVTEPGTNAIWNLTKLTRLTLHACNVTDATLQGIGRLQSLEELSLGLTQITDLGLHWIASLTNLRQLKLNGARITDAGVHHLKPLVNLTRLDLGWTRDHRRGSEPDRRTQNPSRA